MKEFLHWQRDDKGWRTRVVWLGGGARESVENETQGLELKNPLKFSARDLRAMEKNSKNLSPEQKRDFRDMAGYFLSLNQKLGTKNLPPHMLVQIKDSSLFSLLSKKMQEQIQNVLDTQISELADFSRVSLTSPTMAVRASLLYRRLRSRAKADPRLSTIFDDVKKNLLGWALEKLRTGSVSSQVQDALKGVSSKKEITKPLSKQDKLIIASLYRMFPESKDWVDYCDRNTARQFSQEAAEALKANPSDPSMVLGWGFIDEWMAQGDTEMIATMTSTFSQEELTQFIGRSRAVELLQFAQQESPFLPVHLRALNTLKNEPNYLPQAYSETDFRNLAPEEEGIKKINEEQKRLKQKYDETREAQIAQHKQNNPNAPEVLAYEKAVEKKAIAQRAQEEAEKRLEEALGNISEESVSEKTKKEIQLIEKEIEKHKQEGALQEKEEAAAINEMSFSKVFTEQKEQFESKKKALEEEKKIFAAEQKEREQYYAVFSDPQKKAEEATELFWDGLRGRVDNRKLNAADFDVLWNDEFETAVQEHVPNRPEHEKIKKFRTAFEGALEGIFDGLSLPDDRYETWYVALDKQLSYENLITRLKERGFNLREEFKNPQQLSEVLEGAIRKYRENIFNQVKGKIKEEKHDEFYSQWDRLHGHVSTAIPDPTVVEADHTKYEADKLSTVTKIQEEQEKNLSIIEALRKRGENNPELAKHYNDEAEKLEEAWNVRKQWYAQGGQMTIETAEGKSQTIWAPGKNVLSEMAFQTRSVETAIRTLVDEGLKRQIFQVAEEYKELRNMPSAAEKAEKQTVLIGNLKQLFAQWPQIKNKLGQLLQDHSSVLKNLLPSDSQIAQEFAKHVSETAQKELLSLDKQVLEFQRNAHGCNYQYDGDEAFFRDIPGEVQTFLNVIDFNGGRYAKSSEKLDSYLEKDTETVEFLDKSNFFSDTNETKESFRDTYEEMRNEFGSNLSRYKTNFRSVRGKLEKDVKQLNEHEFAARHGGMTPEYMKNLIQDHENLLQHFETGSKKFLDPSFFKTWLANYNKSPESRANALEDMSQFRGLTDWSHEAKNQAVNMEEWLDAWEKGTAKTVNKYTKFSLYDIYALIKQTVEVHNRRWERESERAIADIGLSFYGRNSGWGKEFYRKSQETEEARVKELETEMNEDPWWETQETLYTTNDQDEAKATINLLIEKGVFHWDDKKLWKTLMRLSNNAVFFSDSDMNLDQSEIIKKCRDACEFIWTPETFRQWDTSLESKLKSKEDEFSADFQRYEHNAEARGIILQTMLKNWAQGKRENSDPAKYGLFLRKAFEKGKLNGGPLSDSRWYFMIQGVKYGLLSRDFFGRLNDELLGNMPYFDFFVDKSGWKKDGKLVPANTPGARRPAGWTYKDYLAWADILDKGTSGNFSVEDARKNTKDFFYEVILQSEEARARMDRMVRNGTKTFDHDDAPLFAAGLTLQSVQQMLNTTSTDEDKYTPDFWRGIMAGYVPYFNGIAKYIRQGDKEYGRDNPDWGKIRERNFSEVADRMRAMIVVFHSILGNINLTERKSIVFQKSQFDKKETYSPCARGSFDVSNKVLDKLLDISGKTEEFGDIKDESTWLQPKGDQPPKTETANADNLKKAQKEGKPLNVTNKIYSLTKGEVSNEVFATKNIEKMLLDESFDWGDLMRTYTEKVY